MEKNRDTRRHATGKRKKSLFRRGVALIAVTIAAIAVGTHTNWFTQQRPASSAASPQTSFAPRTQRTQSSDSSEQDWSLIVVNRWNPIPEDYQLQLVELPNGERVDTRIYAALLDMFDAARNDGYYPVVVSGYRTNEQQQSIMEEKIEDFKGEGYSQEQAIAEAQTWVAIPGTSEHELGLSVDINADGVRSAGYEVYEWLDANGYQFGFVRRYPPDKVEITGVSNEPWHYRYVGTKAATDMYEQGLCLEEYTQREK